MFSVLMVVAALTESALGDSVPFFGGRRATKARVAVALRYGARERRRSDFTGADRRGATHVLFPEGSPLTDAMQRLSAAVAGRC